MRRTPASGAPDPPRSGAARSRFSTVRAAEDWLAGQQNGVASTEPHITNASRTSPPAPGRPSRCHRKNVTAATGDMTRIKVGGEWRRDLAATVRTALRVVQRLLSGAAQCLRWDPQAVHE